MSDIVKRLRDWRDVYGQGPSVYTEAANEIERLRAGLRMIENQEYDAGYQADEYASAVLSGDEPEAPALTQPQGGGRE